MTEDGEAYLLIRKSKPELYGTVELPSSKSISNRLIAMRLISGEAVNFVGLSEAEDTLKMLSMEALIRECGAGGGGKEVVLDVGNAGTVFRFLLPIICMESGTWRLTGSPRMLERPIGPLVNALRQLGADITYLGKEGYPPLRISGQPLHGGEIMMDGSLSSQFSSALLMAGPKLKGGLRLTLSGHRVSQPYIDMTLALMKRFGIKADGDVSGYFVDHQPYNMCSIAVEKDWTAASYWYAMLAFSEHGDLFLPGLQADDLQGDKILTSLCEALGVESVFSDGGLRLKRQARDCSRFVFNFEHHPDLAPALCVICAGLGIEAELKGLGTLIVKESNRIQALVNELTRLGYYAEAGKDKIVIANKGSSRNDVIVGTYGDHRIALAFSTLAMVLKGIKISQPEVVGKSYPAYWKQLELKDFELNQFIDSGI